ncbi:hypothetical protein [Alkaliphilus crotonatoxidans]
MMKKIFIYISAIMMIVFLIYFYRQASYSSIITSGFIIEKSTDGDVNYIDLKKVGETKEEFVIDRIIVKEKNTWNLIDVNKAYWIVYFSRNGKDFQLEEIQVNEEFEHIFKEEFGIAD